FRGPWALLRSFLGTGTRQKNRSCLPPTWTREELGKRSDIERFFVRVFLFFHLQRPPLVFLVHHGSAGLLDLHGHHHRCSRCPAGWPTRSHPLSQTCFSSYMGGFLSYEMPSRNSDHFIKSHQQ